MPESHVDHSCAEHAVRGVHGRGDAEEEHLIRFVANGVLWLALAAVAFAAPAFPAEAPVQPIPYSHKQHLAMGLKCANCHEMADPGEMMGIRAAAKCMACHQSVKKESASIQKLAAFAAKN